MSVQKDYIIKLLNGKQIPLRVLDNSTVKEILKTRTWEKYQPKPEWENQGYINKKTSEILCLFLKEGGILSANEEDAHILLFKIVLIANEKHLHHMEMIDKEELEFITKNSNPIQIDNLTSHDDLIFFRLSNGFILKKDKWGRFGELYKNKIAFDIIHSELYNW